MDDGARFWCKSDKDGDCWAWNASRFWSGYGMFWHGTRNWYAQRIAYAMTHGNVPENMVVCHTCDNPSCVNPSHLFLGTMQDNMNDMKAKGRGNRLRGESHGMAKITADDAVNIKNRRLAGERVKDLAKEYGMTCHSIYCIATGKSWKVLR